MVVDLINQYLSDKDLSIDEAVRYEVEKLAGWAFRRQFMDSEQRDSKGKIWLSSIGKCTRQLAYGFHGIEKAGKEMDGRGKITFWIGDMVEMAVIGLARLAKVPLFATGLNQITVQLSVNGFTAYGHPDGFCLNDGAVDLVEIKSMPSYSFDRLEKGDIDETYVMQMQAYMLAANVNRCILVAINKNNGVIVERPIQRDNAFREQIIEKIENVLVSTPETLPVPEYEANDSGEYPWQCLYCSYWKHCHKNAGLVLHGKKYVLKERKEE